MRLLPIAQIIAALIFTACDSSDDTPALTPTPVPTASAAAATPAFTPQPLLPVVELTHDGAVLRVEVASTAEQRARGLSGRPTLGDDEGMLFDLGATRVPSFSMRGMLFPLDFVWIAEDQRVQGITPDVQPPPGATGRELDSYSPSVPVRYVLEVNAGAAVDLGIEEGDALEFALP